MCTAHEMSISSQLGQIPAFTSNTDHHWLDGFAWIIGDSSNGIVANGQCEGWTEAASNLYDGTIQTRNQPNVGW